MNRIRRTIYEIRGKVALKDLKKVPEKVRIKAYVIGDRVVLGSAPVGKNGSFTVKYEHRVFAKRDLPLGVHLVIGPDIPGQGILRTKFPRIPIKPKDFKKTKSSNPHSPPKYEYMIPKEHRLALALVVDWYRRFFYEWRPCVEVKACDSLIAPGVPGAGEEDLNLPNVHVRVSKVYERFFTPPQYYSGLIAEGPVDDDGYFRPKVTIPLLVVTPVGIQLGWYIGDRVEVFQVFPDRTITLHADEIPLGLRKLEDDICQKVGVLKSDVEYPIEAEVPGPGSTFYFERVGDVPVGYIDSATGRADTSTVPATVAGTLRGLYDAAFGGTIKFFADIGVGLVETVKYFRIKYSYEPEDGGAPLVGYIQVPFNNPRWGKEGEPAVVNEFMGPIDASGTYIYPNSYEMMFLPPEEVKDWYFNGLIMQLDTRTLPISFKKYTFTLEPLDADKNPVTVESGTEDLLQLTLLVDNEMPEGEISIIKGPLGPVPACGILRLTPAGTRTSCGQPRDVVNGEIKVYFKARDNNGNLGKIRLWAYFGEYPTCPDDAPWVLPGPGFNLQYIEPGVVPQPGFQNYSDFIAANPTERPLWHGREKYLAVRRGDWDVCAHQIRLWIYKRVTNGENRCIIRPEYTKHITIMKT